MLKNTFNSLRKINLLGRNLSKADFCSSTVRNNFYPDNIVRNLRQKISTIDEEELKDIETDIVNKIHFFDADQYADILILLARQNKGSDMLWDVLSRKVFDFEFDYIQSEALLTALNHTNKCEDYVYDDLNKNMYRHYSNQEEPKSKLFKSFYY